ncbi:hypothetical protein [Ligilactobacillus murinus]|uniref:Uncharacterized protein n=1 Tax=Ligilactobacillus murinus TaxID=1622 RepID=A0AAE6WHY4_9LACO|nr:hypothetical protein [Ligilactobacillus murinus]NEF82852.1 hypothetical protein [Ligilactobacillus murinus]NEF84319.1 hypothetical protein [Ligilactobacillus murinus]NEF87450.1 hypothetical protein [Ligilactobacillus murinus]NEF89752.1 hypothetical protein [Ligilactobacillus murinus]NEF92033.1 hypothetical protein [Ligilactobacillus murinus]
MAYTYKYRSISLRLSEEKDADILNFIDSEIKNKRLSRADVVRQALLAQMAFNDITKPVSKTSSQLNTAEPSNIKVRKKQASIERQVDNTDIEKAKELLLNGFTGI